MRPSACANTDVGLAKALAVCGEQKITDERPLRFLRQMMQERTSDDGRDARPAPRNIPIQRRDARIG